MIAKKYLIFSIIFFGYAVFAYNRKGVSFAIPKLVDDGLENDHIGLIMSSQNLAYAISKFLGGIISDRLSARTLFSTGLLTSGMTAILFAMVNSVPLFSLMWFLNGLSQGVGWPAIAKLLKNWFEPAELGTWWSLASASANVAGCLAPFLASHIIMHYGWRHSLVFVGALAIFAAFTSYLFIVDSPVKSLPRAKSKQQSPSKSKKNEEPKKSGKNSQSSLILLLKSYFIIVISVCYLVSSSIKTSVTDWSQMFLMRDCHQSSLVANSFVSSVEFGGFFGGVAAGYLSDLYMKHRLRGGKVLPLQGHPRMLVATVFSVITFACLYSFYSYVDHLTSAIFINQIGILLGASLYGQIAIYGVVATQSVAGEMSGTAHAIVALAANIGSIVAGLPFSSIAKHYSWSDVFMVLVFMACFNTTFLILNRKVSYHVRGMREIEKKTK